MTETLVQVRVPTLSCTACGQQQPATPTQVVHASQLTPEARQQLGDTATGYVAVRYVPPSEWLTLDLQNDGKHIPMMFCPVCKIGGVGITKAILTALETLPERPPGTET